MHSLMSKKKKLVRTVGKDRQSHYDMLSIMPVITAGMAVDCIP